MEGDRESLVLDKKVLAAINKIKKAGVPVVVITSRDVHL
ncbi:MAG: hypothetical protein CM1200mP10_08950 [Candidatus Neomarinimicrobiota bacterium]|nr:MAG: hypothetical protein CM1200mP10_08950 [Candidatus Neomarinimicrobiota bacterium]